MKKYECHVKADLLLENNKVDVLHFVGQVMEYSRASAESNFLKHVKKLSDKKMIITSFLIFEI